MAITHPACGKTWTGLGRQHCPSCCQTFNSEYAAELHRVGKHGIDRRCLHPAEAGLVAVEYPRGTVWQTPGSDPRRGSS